MAELIEFLPPAGIFGEPVSVLDLKHHARLDDDDTSLDAEIKSVYIPGARQLAETRTGSAIRPARYRQRLRDFPPAGYPITITHGLVTAIESITYATGGGARETLALSAIDSAVVGRETLSSRYRASGHAQRQDYAASRSPTQQEWLQPTW
jgi:hypothetical protein